MKAILIPILIGILVLFSTYTITNAVMMSPLKQINAGILLQNVKCGTGLVLIIDQKDNLPACVRPTSVPRLESYGWITVEKFESIHHLLVLNETNEISIQVDKNDTINNVITPKQIITNDTNFVNVTKIITNSVNTSNNTDDINVNDVYDLYQKYYSNNNVPQLAGPARPLTLLPVNFTESSTEPNSMKVLIIGVDPNPIKVGDTPTFSLTWKNISNKTFYSLLGCGASALGANITPEDHVVVGYPTHRMLCDVKSFPVRPDQINTNYAFADPTHEQVYSNGRLSTFSSAYYTVVKSGILNVTMNLYVGNDKGDYEFTETVKFNVNVTQ